MITERGSIKVTTEINEKMQKEFSRGTYKMGLAFTIIGAICAALFLALEIASIILKFEEGYITFLILAAVILCSGVSIMVAVNKAVATVRNTRKVFVYEFFKEYISANEYLNGENVTTAKVYYGQISKGRETKNYLFFFINGASAFPVDKSQLNEAELNTLRGIFRLPVRGGAAVMSAGPLSPQNTEQSGITPPEPSAPTDPFDEFKN